MYGDNYWLTEEKHPRIGFRHHKQIVLSKEDYDYTLEDDALVIEKTLTNCIKYKDTNDYKLYLMAVSQRLYELGRLVYPDKGLMCKYSIERYENILFENYFIDDNGNDVVNIFSLDNYDGPEKRTCEILRKAISPMISNVDKLAYPGEYAGLIDFIINKANDLPDPKFRKNSEFVTNWEGYYPVDNPIAIEFEKKFGIY